jgi:FkbM family methyltransferase
MLYYRLLGQSEAWPAAAANGGYPLVFGSVRLRRLMTTDSAHRAIAWMGFYELALSRFLARLAKEGGTLVDVGANVGYFSCLWAAAQPANRVHAFEPSPQVVALLRENLAGQNFSSRVRVFDNALGRADEEAGFTLGPAGQTGWGGITATPDGGEISVSVRRLDRLFDASCVIEVLKVDVEGADTWVLYGAEGLLRGKRIKHVFFERNRPRMSQLGIAWSEPMDFLADCGYRVCRINGGEDCDEAHAEPV